MTRYTPSRASNDLAHDLGFLWPVTRLQQEMNRLFSDTFRGLEDGDDPNRGSWTFNPVVDIEQGDDQYEISIELPGVYQEDVNVEVTDDMLVISGSKERKQTRGEGQHRQSERVYGSFQRSFRLPEDAEAEKIQAKFDNGVLTVGIPRDTSKNRTRSRRIEIQRAATAERSRSSQESERSAGDDATGRQST
jgi:HSP20 family protein